MEMRSGDNWLFEQTLAQAEESRPSSVQADQAQLSSRATAQDWPPGELVRQCCQAIGCPGKHATLLDN